VGGLAWLVLSLSLTFIGFSLATINYHAWGAEIGETPQERVRVTAAREMFALGGVVVAAALPSLLAKDVATAMQHLGWVFIPVLALAALARPLPARRRRLRRHAMRRRACRSRRCSPTRASAACW
jgi:GPH family glycoside/pentoside/hexuronide:cation symporter